MASIPKKITALVPELFFASKVEATLAGAGYEVTVAKNVGQVDAGADLVIVDLASGLVDLEAVARELETLKQGGAKVLGFFSHIQPEVREKAVAAGFDLVVPRSRMAREMTALVQSLLEG